MALAFGLAPALTLPLLVLASKEGRSEALVRRHAIVKIGEPRHPQGFPHFDWADPATPKGGRLRLSSIGSFDNINQSTFRGYAAPALSLISETLFAPNPDEPATSYGLVAEWVSFPDDTSFATFGLRPDARFHDGTPITPSDVVFSFEAQVKASPAIAVYYRDVTRVETTGPHEVTFRFRKPGNRDNPYAASLLTVLPRHYWEGRGGDGSQRDITRTTLEPPLGSGPYRIKSVIPARSILYERVPDYWARDLPVNRGQYNFDEVHYTVFRDDVPEFEAFKSGDVDLRVEDSSKRWSTGYEFAARRDGRVQLAALKTATVAGFQGFVVNTRRTRFADPRVRRALALAYDFESANKSLFYGLYKRLDSYFDNSELAARSLPDAAELALLEPFRSKLPPEVFSTAYRSPVQATPADLRRNLREAGRLLEEAGWKLENGRLRHASTGDTLTIEFLSPDSLFDRIVLPYKLGLERLGIQLNIRVVEPTQYEARLKVYDFDMITDNFVQSHAPGNELREYFGSEAADKEASRNRAGIRDGVVDGLIETALGARTRVELVTAIRALDRVLLWSHYMIPQWYNPDVWVAYWDRLGRPQRHPSQDPSPITTWWMKPGTPQPAGARDVRR